MSFKQRLQQLDSFLKVKKRQITLFLDEIKMLKELVCLPFCALKENMIELFGLKKEHSFKLVIKAKAICSDDINNPHRSFLFRSNNYALYLNLYSLEKWFFYFGLFLCLPFYLIFIDSCVFLAFLPLFIYVICFCGLHFKLSSENNRVLINIWHMWPATLDEWIFTLVQEIKIHPHDLNKLKASKNPIDQHLYTLVTSKISGLYAPLAVATPFNHFSKKKDRNNTPISMQERFYLFAVVEFFAHRNQDNFFSQGHIRWLFYWMAPIWIGYICLLIPVFYGFATKVKPDFIALLILLSTWLVLSFSFIYQQVKYIRYLNQIGGGDDWGLKNDNLSYFPVNFVNEALGRNTLSGASKRGTELLGWIYIAAITIYLFLLTLLATTQSSY